MSLTETVIEGTLKPDGTLVLDEKPKLPAGRVTVVLRREQEAAAPLDDPFWQRMRAMWAIPMSTGNTPDGGAATLLEVEKAREEWHERQQAIESLHDTCRDAGRPPGGSKP